MPRWRQLIVDATDTDTKPTFHDPATDAQLQDVQASLSVVLPASLRELLLESNGINFPHGDRIFSTVELVEENRELRTQTDFDGLIFLANAGGEFYYYKCDDQGAWRTLDLHSFLREWLTGLIDQHDFERRFRSYLVGHRAALVSELRHLLSTPLPSALEILYFEIFDDWRVRAFAMDRAGSEVHFELPFSADILPDVDGMIPVAALDWNRHEDRATSAEPTSLFPGHRGRIAGRGARCTRHRMLGGRRLHLGDLGAESCVAGDGRAAGAGDWVVEADAGTVDDRGGGGLRRLGAAAGRGAAAC